MRPFGIHILGEFIDCTSDLDNKEAIEEVVESGIMKCNLGLRKIMSHKFEPIGVTIIALISESHVAIHTFPEAHHVSVDIFTCSQTPDPAKELLNYLKEKFKPGTMRVVEVVRGHMLEINKTDWIISYGAKGTEIRYHIKQPLFSKRTKFQNIDIIENETFGRMLFLDGDLQIAEIGADEYNKAMIAPVVEKKMLGKVAVLGGGDGGVIKELLKHNPKEVVLVEIDEEVVIASKKFLKNICGNAFDDPRVKSVIQDANKFLDSKHNFDAIIYDLTLHPEWITFNDRNVFLEEIFSKISKNLNEGGILSIQCCDEYDKETMELFKKILSKYFKDIKFTKVFIPAFCVNWIFASATKK